MPSATITLKLSPDRKRALQRAARRRRQSLNAYVLEHLAPARETPRLAVDYEAITAPARAALAGLGWRDVLDRE